MYAVPSVKYDIARACMISCVYCIVTYVRDPGRFRGSHYLSFHGTVLHLRAVCCVLTAPRFLFRQPVRLVSGQLVLSWWRDLGSGAACKLPLQYTRFPLSKTSALSLRPRRSPRGFPCAAIDEFYTWLHGSAGNRRILLRSSPQAPEGPAAAATFL